APVTRHLPDSGCAWVADFAGLVPILPMTTPYFACFQSLLEDSGSAYRGSNPWGAAKQFQSLPRVLLYLAALVGASWCVAVFASRRSTQAIAAPGIKCPYVSNGDLNGAAGWAYSA